MRFLLCSAAYFSFISVASAACPDPGAMGDRHDYSGSDLYSKKTFVIQAGGSIDIRNCKGVNPPSGRPTGFVIERPDFTFKLNGMGSYKLVLDVESECDSILLINTGSATWYYDDDDGGNLDARIELTRPANGWLDVWVGTVDGEYCSAELSLETFDR